MKLKNKYYNRSSISDQKLGCLFSGAIAGDSLEEIGERSVAMKKHFFVS